MDPRGRYYNEFRLPVSTLTEQNRQLVRAVSALMLSSTWTDVSYVNLYGMLTSLAILGVLMSICYKIRRAREIEGKEQLFAVAEYWSAK
jgi:uncharacterized oligopeptide transporter (OPT) family protein